MRLKSELASLHPVEIGQGAGRFEDWPNSTSNVEQLKGAKEIINAIGRPVVNGAEAIKYLDIPYARTKD